MLDIKFIRENKDLIKHAAKIKHVDFDVDKLLEVDEKRRALQLSYDEKRSFQNKEGTRMTVPGLAEEEKLLILKGLSIIKEEMKLIESDLKTVMLDWQKLMVSVPNIPDVSVPEGESDADNKEVKNWVPTPEKKFDFEPKDHIALMELHDMADFEKGASVAGFRGYFLKNDGARLEMALLQFALDHFSGKGFIPMIVPSLVRRETLLGTGYLPQGEEDLYKTQDGEYLAGTGEVAGMSYFADQVLEKKDLPKKILAFSPCFRREAGAHGKDVKGLYRVHEFLKLEQIVLCEASHEESVKFHEEITANAENMLQKLGIPYHVVINCGGDLGLGQVKKYDIECWRPSMKNYGETHSSSYFHDFQTRRLNIRYKDDSQNGESGLKFVHSLNNTAAAMPRLLIPLVENYQQADGSIVIPEILRPYMGGKEKIG
ncbi:MAG TPA: serine--tRNA ligase [Candidatus Paceibacterota bacterium]